jgi:hypothetical protein
MMKKNVAIISPMVDLNIDKEDHKVSKWQNKYRISTVLSSRCGEWQKD